MTHLILIRHGETDWNRARRIQGATDIPLNDTGRAQAREAGLALRARLATHTPLVLVSSDLQRAAETADIIGAILERPVTARYPELRERSYGEAEGVSIDELAERWGRGPDARVPGAETREQLRERAVRAVSRVISDASAEAVPPVVVAVAHGALIREVLAYATDDQLPADGDRLGNGSAQEFSWEGGLLRLLSYSSV
ncbi:broad specificity phosphatase PhoE [Microbacterium sp. SORGH_AS428]|uniref:histidine phosphatase family protein n=1 Tax=Microbacterium sp. SORGH_AS_0428 TaxID=3041788 RepID=UPI002857FC88|nr:histidine phosphatase family protein [Microbacterium sp. SORGH_AS_0428]MDR6198361.1 broad specificity phosphatase PhoE [Microbacterium sp. SORGH_AS_0428]